MDAVTEKSKVAAGLQPLLESLIDYAGLFPPAGLAMDAVVSNYARYRAERYAWMLGRFVVPVARLSEFEDAWAANGRPSGWRLSALVANGVSDVRKLATFNAVHSGALQIDALELKAASVEEIKHLADTLPRNVAAYIEIPISSDPVPLLTALQQTGLRVKVRTGGLTADLFPDANLIARFLRSAADVGVPFKATAGLHHPVRCERALTYDLDSARGTMHGFVNVFLAAAFARKRQPADVLEQLLLEADPVAFHFDDRGAVWQGRTLTKAELAEARTNFAIAFGSCSFEEPISDLQALGLLL